MEEAAAQKKVAISSSIHLNYAYFKILVVFTSSNAQIVKQTKQSDWSPCFLFA